MFIFFFILLVVFTVLFSCGAMLPVVLNKVLVVIFGIECLLFFISHKKCLKHNYFTPGILIVICYFIVFLQIPLFYYAGDFEFTSYGDTRLWITDRQLQKSFLLSLVAFTSFFLGFHFCFSDVVKNNIPPTISPTRYRILIMLCLIFFVLLHLSYGSDFWHGRYGTSYNHAWYTKYLNFIFEILLLSAIIIKQYVLFIENVLDKKCSVMTYVKKMGWALSVMTVLYVLGKLNLGTRAPAVLVMIAYSWFFIFIKEIKIYKIIVLLVAALSISAFVSNIRTASGEKNYKEALSNLQNRAEIFENQPQVLYLSTEYSMSILCTHIVVENMPNQYSFFGGRELLYNLFSGIPIYASFFRKYFLREYSGLPGASFITYLYYGVPPNEADAGTGTNQIAEFYMDFGVIGVVLGMFLIGFVVRKSYSVLQRKTVAPGWFIVTAILFCCGPYSARGNLFFYFMHIIYIYIVLSLLSEKNNVY